MQARRPILAALLLLAVGSGGAGAASPKLPLGRYIGQTSDGHVFQFTVVRNANPTYPRRITHFYLVYDLAGCRSTLTPGLSNGTRIIECWP